MTSAARRSLMLAETGSGNSLMVRRLEQTVKNKSEDRYEKITTCRRDFGGAVRYFQCRLGDRDAVIARWRFDARTSRLERAWHRSGDQKDSSKLISLD